MALVSSAIRRATALNKKTNERSSSNGTLTSLE